MKRNVGVLDRSLRAIAGALLLYVGLLNTGIVDNEVVRYIMVAFGGINIATAILAFCPMYTLASLSTAPGKH